MTINAHFRGEFDANDEPIFHCPTCNLGMVGGYPVIVKHVERVHDGEVKQFDAQLVMLAIENGLCDNYLQQILDKAESRREVVNTRKAINLDRGDKFTLVNISPKLLAGEEVEFVRHEDSWLVCTFIGYPRGKYRHGQTVRVRHSHVGDITFRSSGTNIL